MDRAATFTALVFYSMPTFVLGLLMVELLYYQLTIHGLRWFPGSGYTSPTQSLFEWFRGLSCLGSLLPWCLRPHTHALPVPPCWMFSVRTTSEQRGQRAHRAARHLPPRAACRTHPGCHAIRDRRRHAARRRRHHRERVRTARTRLYRRPGDLTTGPARDHRRRDSGGGGRRGRQHLVDLVYLGSRPTASDCTEYAPATRACR